MKRESTVGYRENIPVAKIDNTWNEKLDNYRRSKHKRIKGAVRMVLRFLDFCRIKDGVLLDIGCGSGWFHRYVPRVNYIGLEVLIRRDVAIDFPMVVGLGEDLPFKDESVDHVLIYATLDHVMDPTRVLKESFRVLRKGGGVYILSAVKMPNTLRKAFVYALLLTKKIIFFDYESIIRNAKKTILNQKDKYHTFEFSDNDMKDMLLKSGYSAVLSKNYFNTSFLKAEKT